MDLANVSYGGEAKPIEEPIQVNEKPSVAKDLRQIVPMSNKTLDRDLERLEDVVKITTVIFMKNGSEGAISFYLGDDEWMPPYFQAGFLKLN